MCKTSDEMLGAFTAIDVLGSTTHAEDCYLHPMDKILLPDLEALRGAPNTDVLSSSRRPRSSGDEPCNQSSSFQSPTSHPLSWPGQSNPNRKLSGRSVSWGDGFKSTRDGDGWKSALAEVQALEAVMTCCPTANLNRKSLSGFRRASLDAQGWKSELVELQALEAVMTFCPTAKCIGVPSRRPMLNDASNSGNTQIPRFV